VKAATALKFVRYNLKVSYCHITVLYTKYIDVLMMVFIPKKSPLEINRVDME